MSATGGNAEVIAKKGDVILQLGKVGVGEGVRNILVSSMVLSLASPVFATMFDGRFSEGHNLSPASPRTVPLPDDDPECITMICKIGHMQTSQLSTKLTAMALSKLALVCNKYDCVDTVRAWAIIWVAALLETPATQDFEKMVLATYLLDLRNEFFKVSQSLIRDQSAMFSITNAMDGHEFLPGAYTNAYSLLKWHISGKSRRPSVRSLQEERCAVHPSSPSVFSSTASSKTIYDQSTITQYRPSSPSLRAFAKSSSLSTVTHAHPTVLVAVLAGLLAA